MKIKIWGKLVNASRILTATHVAKAVNETDNGTNMRATIIAITMKSAIAV